MHNFNLFGKNIQKITKNKNHEKSIYIKRRLIAILILVLLIFFIVLSISSCINNKKNSATSNENMSQPQQSPQTIQQDNTQKITDNTNDTVLTENDIIKIIESSSDTNKTCYLTFDDGPNNSITLQILDILRKYNVKATFFEVGSLIESNPDSARRVYEEGHLIANHSYAHNYSELYASNESFMTEINKTEELIKSIIDDNETVFKLIRFPGGSYNSGSYGAKKQEYKETLKQNNYYYADWNCLIGDAEGRKKTADEMLEYLKKTMNNKNKAIVLLHDAANKKTTVEALPKIIEYFISQGYNFKRLDEI